MDETLRNRLLDAVHRRATALAKLTAPTHPGRHLNVVISQVAVSCVRTLLVLLGEQFLRDWITWLVATAREHDGVCPFCCAQPLRPDRTMCQECWDGLSREDAEIERHVLLYDTPPRGGVS